MKQFLAKRVFKFEKEILPDPNPELSEKDVLIYYSNTYPDLVNCSVSRSSVNEKEIVYEFTKGISPKG